MGLLELLKQGEIRAEQKERYGDIAVTKRDGSEEPEINEYEAEGPVPEGVNT
jgi:chromatin segregation and condensation protein Rec8/ScpA/Scc1 (kleisin family)